MRGSTWSAGAREKQMQQSPNRSGCHSSREHAPPSQHRPTGSSAQSRTGSRAPIHLLPSTLGFGFSCLCSWWGWGSFLLFFQTHQGLLPDKMSLVLWYVFWYMSIASIFLLHLSKIGQGLAFFFGMSLRKISENGISSFQKLCPAEKLSASPICTHIYKTSLDCSDKSLKENQDRKGGLFH